MYSLSTWSCPSSSQAQIPGERRPGQGCSRLGGADPEGAAGGLDAAAASGTIEAEDDGLAPHSSPGCRLTLVPALPGGRGKVGQDGADVRRGGPVVRRGAPGPADLPGQVGAGQRAGPSSGGWCGCWAATEDCPSDRTRQTSVCVGAERVARHDHELAGARGGDLVYDALQHGKPQRKDDGIGALQRVAVAGGDTAARPICAPAFVPTQGRRSRAAGSRRLRRASGRWPIRAPPCR